MASKLLTQAREFEQEYLPFTAADQPGFHATGGIGWINDPNGFSVYKGEYHLFSSITPMMSNGARCTGAMSKRRTSSNGIVFRRHLRRIRNMTAAAVSPAAQRKCRTDGSCSCTQA